MKIAGFNLKFFKNFPLVHILNFTEVSATLTSKFTMLIKPRKKMFVIIPIIVGFDLVPKHYAGYFRYVKISYYMNC